MPYAKILGHRVHYTTSGSFSGGFAVFWYSLFGGLTFLCLVLGIVSYIHYRQNVEDLLAYNDIESSALGIVFFGLFWLIPLVITSVSKLTKGSKTSSPPIPLTPVDEEIQALRRLGSSSHHIRSAAPNNDEEARIERLEHEQRELKRQIDELRQKRQA